MRLTGVILVWNKFKRIHTGGLTYPIFETVVKQVDGLESGALADSEAIKLSNVDKIWETLNYFKDVGDLKYHELHKAFEEIVGIVNDVDAEQLVTPRINWMNPTPLELETPEFVAIWNVIRHWVIDVPETSAGYRAATGNHVRAILLGLQNAGIIRDPGSEAGIIDVVQEYVEGFDVVCEPSEVASLSDTCTHVTPPESKIEDPKFVRVILKDPRRR